MVNVALAREKLPAVPIGAHAVELLAHPPVRQIGGVVPAFGEQQRRSGVFLAFVITTRLGSDRELRKRTACAGFLGGISAQPAQMFAGALLDGDGLIAPRRATARIDTAGILQNIGLRSRSLHLSCLAVLKIWHKLVPFALPPPYYKLARARTRAKTWSFL